MLGHGRRLAIDDETRWVCEPRLVLCGEDLFYFNRNCDVINLICGAALDHHGDDHVWNRTRESIVKQGFWG